MKAPSLLLVAGTLACTLHAVVARPPLTLTLCRKRERGPVLPLPLAGEGRGEGKPCETEPHLLPALSLGHAALAADLTMVRAQVYFGAEREAGRPARLLERTLETAVALDPSVRQRYLRGAAMLIYSGSMVSADGVQAADRLLQRGARAFPDDWELWFQLGFNRLYELPELAAGDDAWHARWRRDGQAALARAARLPGAPPWVGELAQQAAARGER